MDGRLEIPPCVLQDIGPLGPLPKKQGTGAFSVQGIKINRKYHSLPTLPNSHETRSNLAQLQVQILMRNGMKSICRDSFFLFSRDSVRGFVSPLVHWKTESVKTRISTPAHPSTTNWLCI